METKQYIFQHGARSRACVEGSGYFCPEWDGEATRPGQTKKVQNDAQVKNSKPVKKAQMSKVVITANSGLKVSKHLSSEEQCTRAEDQVAQVEELTLTDTGVSFLTDQPAVRPQKVTAAVIEQIEIPEESDVEEQAGDCLMNPEYMRDIFDYLRNREENCELNHETLYLAVKLTDHYLSITEVMRESLQLIGSAALLIAAKFEERCPPTVDDFLYICDDAYQRREFLVMERNILQGLDFDINIPVPYRFLRHYAKVACASMETLTLARYVCELSLLEVELVPEPASCLASACLLLALITHGLGGWTAVLQYHSGYTLCELGPLVRRLYAMLASPTDENLRVVKNKYSHKVFFEVAETALVSMEMLEEVLSEPDFTRS